MSGNELSPKTKLYISLGIIGFILLLSFSIIFFGVYQVYFSPASLFRHDFASAGPVEEHFEERIVNVVLLGLHNRQEDNTFGEVYFVDTILIAAVNFDQNAVDLLSVPRDSYVEIAGSGVEDRIRQAYSYGFEESDDEVDPHEKGLKRTIETIENYFDCIDLHYSVAMDIQGLKQVIDSLGGVYYNVEKPMIGFTPQESLEAGPQQLDGQGYITYLTYREEDARDDLNRIGRQKALLMATYEYFKEMGLFRYIIPVYEGYRGHVRTDLSFNQIAALTLFAAERLEAEDIYDYSLQGEYFLDREKGVYYLQLDEDSCQALVEDIF
mgnify:CR=1 FL=1